MFGNGSYRDDQEVEKIYAQAGRRLLGGSPIGDIVDVPALRREVKDLRLSVSILQKEVFELQQRLGDRTEVSHGRP